MDWARAIEINSRALIRIVAELLRIMGLDGSTGPARMQRSLHRNVLRVLRPAESAARRLIVIAARGLVAKAAPAARPAPRMLSAKGRGANPAFRLYDTRKNFAERRRRHTASPGFPRISVLGYDPCVAALWPAARPALQPAAAQPAPDDGLIDAAPLSRRLRALKAALDNVPRQAMRLARWQAKRARIQALRPAFATPIRPGLPPGYRKKPSHDVDHVLSECHGLALHAIAPNTS